MSDTITTPDEVLPASADLRGRALAAHMAAALEYDAERRRRAREGRERALAGIIAEFDQRFGHTLRRADITLEPAGDPNEAEFCERWFAYTTVDGIAFGFNAHRNDYASQLAVITTCDICGGRVWDDFTRDTYRSLEDLGGKLSDPKPRHQFDCQEEKDEPSELADVDDGDYIANRVAERDDTPPAPYE